MFLIGTLALGFNTPAQNIDETVEKFSDEEGDEIDQGPVEAPKKPPAEAKIEIQQEEKKEAPPPPPALKPTIEMPAEKESAKYPLVEVEPAYAVTSDVTGALMLVPYRLRRDSTGVIVGFSYSNFEPIDYEPRFITGDFDSIYSTAEGPLFEFTYGYKWHLFMGSIGLELGAGIYSNTSEDPDVDSTLTLIPVKAGIIISLDNLFYEPYVVPYGGGGVYTIVFKEELAATSFNGTTQAAPYWVAGLLFQLNWLDKVSARTSYIESGVENTFLYAEARQMFTSSAAADPDFGTEVHLDAGIKVEF